MCVVAWLDDVWWFFRPADSIIVSFLMLILSFFVVDYVCFAYYKCMHIDNHAQPPPVVYVCVYGYVYICVFR